MAETEVETILREIRERVLTEQSTSAMVDSVRPNNGAGLGQSETNLALLNSYLTTTARAWDRLPPVVSNRSGALARLELWLKGHFKRATRWYAWEQVNFNAAVHHALHEMTQLLTAHEESVAELKAQMAALKAQMDQQVDLQTFADYQLQLNARVADLTRELRERDEHLREEQHVCFKQLALENSEAAVLEDRARRQSEASIAELKRRIEELEARRS